MELRGCSWQDDSFLVLCRVLLPFLYHDSPPDGVKWFSPLLCEAEDYRLIN